MSQTLSLFLLGLLGAGAGSLINWGVYRLAYAARAISPWSAPSPGTPPRRRRDRLPIVGWWGLRREAAQHGRGFWIRPMLVEVLTAVGLPALYWWEVLDAGSAGMTPANFWAHAGLMVLMLVASLIDLDEKTIPDAVTVPGTLLGLAVVAFFPGVLLPIGKGPLWIPSPASWPAGLDGFPAVASLALGGGCWWLWCVGLMPRTWYARHGWRRAARLCLARLARDPASHWMGLLAAVGTLPLAAAWWRGGDAWRALLTALFGMAAGGLIIWAVRIVGTAVLRREAMGFGDVTLMAMIGVLLGWQGALIVFFLAPLAALGVGLLILVLRRETEIPYGPFLCLATVATIVRWPDVWDHVQPAFALGLLVPALLAAGLALMVVLLWLLQGLKRLLGLG